MEYLAKFDNNGRRIDTVAKGIHYNDDVGRESYIAEGFVTITEEDWNYYVGNRGKGANGTGYIRDAETGKPVSAPPYVPTKEELAQRLYDECQADLRLIDGQITNAIAMGNNDLVTELRQERQERIEQYQKDLAELEGGDE